MLFQRMVLDRASQGVKSISYHRQLGLFALTAIGVNSILGSTWLFGAWKAARLAGPSAVLCWPIGVAVILLFAMSYAKISAHYPTSGGMARYTQLSHGALAGFIAGWANWITGLCIIAVEAISSIQYISSWPFYFTQHLYDNLSNQLTTTGLALSAILIFLFFLLNYWSVKIFLRTTLYLSIIKIGIPFLSCATLIIVGYSQHHFNFTKTSFMPYGMHGVFTAVATSGVIFAFNGFQGPINLSDTVKNPVRNVPLAIFFALMIMLVLYVLLQIAFIGNVSADELRNGWNHLSLRSPLVYLALILNLHWLMILLYVDAVVSPSGAAIINTATTSRLLYGLQKNGHMPTVLGSLHPKYHIPRIAMWINLIISFIFLYVFRDWGSLVAVISVSSLVVYAIGPIAAISLQKWHAQQRTEKQTPFLKLSAPFAFVLISWILYWARWPLTGHVILILFSGLPIYFYYQYKAQWANFKNQLLSGLWLVGYLCSIMLISWCGSTTYGGKGLLNTTASMISILIIAIAFYFWGIESSYAKKFAGDSYSEHIKQTMGVIS